jgi:RNA-directed DNA polymerase
MDSGQLFSTSEGTPQGGVISPLLANIALHGMEERINKAFPEMSKPAGKLGITKKVQSLEALNLSDTPMTL